MDSINYFPLFIIFVIAWLVPLVLSWLEIGKLPAVIVEIVLGVVIGPFVLNLVDKTPYMDFLSVTGFLILIFLAGLEIDVAKIISSFPRKRVTVVDFISNSLLLALFIYFGSLVLSIPFAIAFDKLIEIDLIFYIILLPTAAIGMIVPIVKGDGEVTRKFGQVMLLEGGIATIMSIIFISLYSGVLNNGFSVELLLFTLIFAVFFLTYIVGKRLMRVNTFQKLLYTLEHAASQIRVRGAVALLLFFVIIAHLIGTEVVMGAFFAGALLSLFVNKKRSALMFKLDGMSYGFFIPIFFISVGINLDLSALSQFQDSVPFILLLTLGFFVVQVLPSLIMVKVFGWKKSVAGGVLLSARMSETIATAQIGVAAGVISSADNAGIVTASILSSIIAPLIYKLFNNGSEEHHSIYIIGGSRASLLLAERLKMHETPCLTILDQAELIPDFERRGINFKYINQLNTSHINELKLRPSDLIVMLTGAKSLNLELTRYIKNELHHSKIITRKQSASHDLVDLEGEVKMVDHEEILASHIENMIMRPDAVGSLADSFGEYRVEEIHITNKSVHRKMVKEVAFPPSGSLVIHRRGGEIFIPHGDTHLLTGDVITVIGNSTALVEFRRLLEK